MSHLSTRTFTVLAGVVACLTLVPLETRLAGQQQVKMNYLDALELDQALNWAAMSPHAQVLTIG